MMKNKSLAEKIGALLILVCVMLLVIQFAWKDNPIPFSRESLVFINCIGLVILAVGQKKRERKEKSD